MTLDDQIIRSFRVSLGMIPTYLSLFRNESDFGSDFDKRLLVIDLASKVLLDTQLSVQTDL